MAFISALSDEEQADLSACCGLVVATAHWRTGTTCATRRMRSMTTASPLYLLGEPLLSDYLEEGLSQFGFSCADFEIGRL